MMVAHAMPSLCDGSGGFVAAVDGGGGSAYISYEHPDCGVWPPLDDGSPVPARVPFVQIVWDGTARTFTGMVDWQAAGSTWQGCARWRYTMTFDPSMTAIVAGQVEAASDPVPGQPRRWEQMGVFGQTLVYVNAAAEQRLVAALRTAEADAATAEAAAARAGGQPWGAVTAVEEPAAGGAAPQGNAHIPGVRGLRRQAAARERAAATVEQELLAAGASARTISLVRLLWVLAAAAAAAGCALNPA